MSGTDDGATPEGAEPRTNLRGAVIFAIAIVLVAAVVVGVFAFGGKSDPVCAEWEDAKAEWVATFAPIQQRTKSDLADFQGWVEIDGTRVDRPEGC